MKILVTGGAGFIGTNLIKKLVSKKYEIVSIDNYSTSNVSTHQPGCTYVYGDLSKIKDYSIWSPDTVYHLGALARIQPSFEAPVEYFETNSLGTLNVCDWCSKNNVPMIYAGSSSTHDGRFKNPYTFSKTIGEEIIKLYQKNFKLKASIARFYNVYGPHQLTEGRFRNLIGTILGSLKRNEEFFIYGDGEQRRDFTHVDDIVDGLVLIAEKKAYGYEFELGRGKNYSVNEVVKLFNLPLKYKEGKPGEARTTLNTSTLAKEILGWSPKINLDEYIKTLEI